MAHAVFLGLVQGVTEFLPVSSSGHLALVQLLLPGFKQPGVLLDVMLHVGTLFAVAVYFRKELWEILMLVPAVAGRGALSEQGTSTKRLVAGIVAASVPTALIGLLLEHRVEWMFGSMAGVGIALMVTGAVLFAGEKIGDLAETRPGESRPGLPWIYISLLIGAAQGIAVIPGISRSGATISMARVLGVEREEAARFSFLVSLPAVAGGALLSVFSSLEAIGKFGGAEIAAYLAGPAVAAVCGYAAISVVMRMIKGGTFIWFALYCAILGAASLLASLLI